VRAAFTRFCAAALAPCLVGAAQAADLADTRELESLLTTPVYAASKYQQSLADAPAAVTIITQGEIRAFGWRTLAEALNAVRGVYTRYDRAYSYVGVRGFGRPGDYSSRLLLLVDGVRVNENIYDSVMVGRDSPIDVDLIERIEFIPGPGSAVHGSNAVLGTINLVTRSAASLRGTHASVAADTRQGWKIGATTTAESGTGSLLLAANLELRPGQTLAFPEYDSPATPGGVVSGLDRESAARLFARFEAGAWSLQALAGRRAKEIPNAPFGLVFGDPAAEWTDTMGQLGLSWHPDKINGEGWYAQASLGRYDYRDYGRYEPDARLERFANRGRWLRGEVNRSFRAGGRQLLLLGADVQRDLTQEVSQRQLEPTLEQTVDLLSARGTRFGVHAGDDIKLGNGWNLSLGARLDRDARGNWTTTPRSSLLWRPTDSLTLKALAGRAFRDPNAYERVSYDQAANAAPLGREQTKAGELAADWQLSAAIRLSASLYRYKVSDLIEQVGDEDADEAAFANVGKAVSRGAELEFEYLGSRGLRVRSSLSRQSARDEAGLRLSNSPEWLGKLHATVPIPSSPLRAALELQGMGRRLTGSGAALPAQLLTNLSLAWNQPGRSWSAVLSVSNVFDQHVSDPTSPEYRADRVVQDGREATLRLNFAF
jgi:outer membrane receptor protein involved in Fe transport